MMKCSIAEIIKPADFIALSILWFKIKMKAETDGNDN